MRIDDRVIEEIKNKANIVDVISRYINVIKKGNNYLAICPFHNDSNPSMNISESKQIYKCFSCGAGGNVFTFVSEYEKVGFIDAVVKVANIVGYDLSEYEIDTPKVDTKKEKLLKLVKDACEFYNYNLLNSDNEGIKYLSGRGITIDIIDNFKLGYAPSDSSKTLRYLTKKGYTVEEIVEAGIGISNNGFLDRFSSRVVFPISDINGNVVAFSGRRIDEGKANKYINSNENILFNKSECLYNFYGPREHRSERHKEPELYHLQKVFQRHHLRRRRQRPLFHQALSGTPLSAAHLQKRELQASRNLQRGCVSSHPRAAQP